MTNIGVGSGRRRRLSCYERNIGSYGVSNSNLDSVVLVGEVVVVENKRER